MATYPDPRMNSEAYRAAQAANVGATIYTPPWITPQGFGAKADGISDDTQAWQLAVGSAAANNTPLCVPDGVYLVKAAAVVDTNVQLFRNLRIFGFGRGDGEQLDGVGNVGAGCGPVILTNGGGALDITFRYGSESVDIRGLVFKDTATWPAFGAAPAIKITKYPGRYISNLNFEDIAGYGYSDVVKFVGMGTSVTDNYIGRTVFRRFFPYDCGCGIKVQDATLNMLHITESQFHGCGNPSDIGSGGAICLTQTTVGGSIDAQISATTFEGCLGGMFRIPSTAPELSKITLIDVYHESCGVYIDSDTGAYFGDPWAISGPCEMHILGRHDWLGQESDGSYLYTPEGNRPSLGAGSSICVDSPMSLRLDGGNSLSPEKINTWDETYSVASANPTTATKELVLAEGVGNAFNIEATLEIDGGAHGVYTCTASGTTGGAKYRVTGGPTVPGIAVSWADGDAGAFCSLVVVNTTGLMLSCRLRLTKNYSGWQVYTT